MIIRIDNPGAEELKIYTSLKSAPRNGEGSVFIAESVNVITAALEAGCVPVSMLSEERHILGKGAELVSRLAGVPVYTAPDALLESITGYEMHRGMLCAFKRPSPRCVDDILSGARRICVLEALTDTTNLGAIFRSAAALNIDAVLLSPECCDPLSRRALRVSTGNVFRLPWAFMEGNYIEPLRAAGFLTCALALTDKCVSISDPQLKTAAKLALILGSEGSGLKPDTIAACDVTVKIPMRTGVDSLNVAAAAAVAFWEVTRD